jgi:predicted nucleotidyltransferase
MELAFRHAQPHEVAPGQSVRVAPPAVVAVLKVVSYLERPPERERDLADIAHLLDQYVDEDSPRRWEEARDIEFDLAPAYLLGLDIHGIVDAHRPLVDAFLDRVGPEDSTAHSIMERVGPATWRGQEAPLARRVAAFRTGYETEG